MTTSPVLTAVEALADEMRDRQMLAEPFHVQLPAWVVFGEAGKADVAAFCARFDSWAARRRWRVVGFEVALAGGGVLRYTSPEEQR